MAKRKAEASAEEIDVNPRGEIAVELDGNRYVLRPSEKAVIAIEEELGASLEQLVSMTIHSQLTLNQMAVIVTHMMRAYAEANPEASADYRGARVDKVRSLIFEAGVPRTRARIAPLLVGAMTGGYTAEGEAKATGTK